MPAVLDASALLTLFLNEPGADRVLNYFPDVVMSAVNASEVITKLIELGVPPSRAEDQVLRLGISIDDFDMTLAAASAALRPLTRSRGLSLGDRACLALSMKYGSVAVTADRQWTGLDVGCQIDVIR